MVIEQELPIELECWLLNWGLLPNEHRNRKPDIAWPNKKEVATNNSKGWKPSYVGEQPPF